MEKCEVLQNVNKESKSRPILGPDLADIEISTNIVKIQDSSPNIINFKIVKVLWSTKSVKTKENCISSKIIKALEIVYRFIANVKG